MAKISGYSKWHLQRKFKNIVGLQLASYIRDRVLTRAAVALRISRRPILEISDALGFDSQQTFTRTFKKRFGVTPNSFRQMEHWDVQGMIPRFGFYENYTAEIKRVSLTEQHLVGFTRRLNFDEGNLYCGHHSSCIAIKNEILLDFFKEVNFSCQRIYSIFSAKNCQQEQNSVFYSTAIDKEKRHEIQSSREVDYIVIPAGQFLSISHQGSAKECIKFATYLFHDLLPKLRNEAESGIEIEVIEIDSCHAESKLRDIAVVYRYLLAVN